MCMQIGGGNCSEFINKIRDLGSILKVGGQVKVEAHEYCHKRSTLGLGRGNFTVAKVGAVAPVLEHNHLLCCEVAKV